MNKKIQTQSQKTFKVSRVENYSFLVTVNRERTGKITSEILESERILSFGSMVVSSETAQNFLTNAKIGDIFSWNEVSEIHKICNGIYQRNGKLISLLTDFGKINPCYPDFHGDTTDTIFYTGAGRRGDQRLDSFNQALFNAIESRHAVPLFNKLSVGRWQFLGFWHVSEGKYIFDESQDRMIWKFTLQRDKNARN